MRQEQRQHRAGGSLKMSNSNSKATPALFLCPISLEIMRDPVIVCTGQTYDRPSIEKWIRDGHRSCPITMLHLHDLTLIPNIIVRQLIEAWCSSEESTSSMFLPPPPPFHESPERLLTSSSDETEQHQLNPQLRQHQSDLVSDQVLCLLRRIAKGQDVKQSVVKLKSMVRKEEEPVNRTCGYIVEGGGPLLMASMLADELLHRGTPLHDHTDNPCEEIMSLLSILCRNSPREVTGALLSESGALDCVIAHLTSGGLSTSTRITAAMLIKRLLLSEEIRVALGRSSEFFRGLMELTEDSMFSASRKSLVKILHRVSLYKPNRSRAVEEGAIHILVKILCTFSPSSSSSNNGSGSGAEDLETGERALATLELLCTVEQGRRAVCDSAAAVHCAVRMLVGYSRQVTENATGCLLLVCQSGPVEVLQVAMRAGAKRQLLLLLQSDCTGRAKKKALELLKLFHAIFFVPGEEHVSSDFKNVDLY